MDGNAITNGQHDGPPHDEPPGDPGKDNAARFPPEVLALARRVMGDTPLVAHSEFDLDGALRYTSGHVLLSETELVIVEGTSPETMRRFELATLSEASVEEGLGVDRLKLIRGGAREEGSKGGERGGELVAVARYTRRHRILMQRLNRKLQRRLPKPAGSETAPRPPDWLEDVERQAESRELCPKCHQFIPPYAEGACPNCLQKKSILWRLMDSARPYRRTLNFAIVLTLLHALFISIPVYIQSNLIDRGLAANHLSNSDRLFNVLLFGGLLLSIILITETLGGWRLITLNQVGTRISHDLRHQTYAHLHTLSLRFFNKRRTGSLISRVTNDTDRLQEFIVYASVNFLRDTAMVVCSASVMFWMNWRLASIAIIPVPIVAVMTYLRGRKMHKLWARSWNYWSRISAVVGDALPGVRVIKAFSAEEKEVGRFDKRSLEYMEKEQEATRTWWTLQPLVSGIMRFGGLMVTVVGGVILIFDKSGHTTIGQLLAFSGQVWQFYGPVNELANANRMLTRAASSAARVYEILDTPPDIYGRRGSHAPKSEDIRGEIEFRNVAFAYEGAQPALRDVSLTIRAGEMIGLAGPSGAGKSTFVNLIPRFYDVVDGQILLDGVDLRDWDLSVLRKSVGMVLQEPYLFHGTIADNIRYGRPDATYRDIIEAARAANAHDFIIGFPDGYDTMVGERGQSLSGGERQRVSIARAILQNPRILLLDEATSSVDTETEKQIQQALDRLVKGRTTIAIAHRLSTLTAADRLVVLERGTIVETGTHAELSEKEGGVYAKLVRTQKELGSLVAVAG